MDKPVAAAEPDEEMYTALSLEWATGISRSELLGVRWIDFNFSTDTVSIRRAAIITDNGTKLDDTKTDARQRVLPPAGNHHAANPAAPGAPKTIYPG